MPNRHIREFIQDKEVVTAPIGSSVRDVAWLMKEKHVTAVLIVKQERLAGICTERDIVLGVVAEDQSPDQTSVGEIMTHHPRTITADRPFGHALHLMYEGGFRHVPVVDKAGHPIGLVSARDALGLDALQFEEELVRREEIAVIL